MKALVSVVVPIYNIQEYLSECVSSILAQTYSNFEIVLVDDGSTDESGEIADYYAEKYDNIRVVHKENAGLGFARNTGIDNSTGEYIMFIDGDDYIAENHLYNLMNDIGNCDACYGGYSQQVDDKFVRVENPLNGQQFEGADITKKFFPRMCGKLDYHCIDEVQMSSCMVLYRLSLIKSKNIRFHSERELISEDLIFNLDYLLESKKIVVSNNCGYFYRSRTGSLTDVYNPERLSKQTYFTKYLMNKTMGINNYYECEQRIFSTYLAWVRVIIQSEQKQYLKNGLKKSIGSIKKICEDTFVCDVIDKYDLDNLTPKVRIMVFLIKHKKACWLWILCWMKNKIG